MIALLCLAPHVLTTAAVCFLIARGPRWLRRVVGAALTRLLLGGVVFLVVLNPLGVYPPSVSAYAPKAVIVYLLVRAILWAIVTYLFNRPEKSRGQFWYIVVLGTGGDFLADLSLPLLVDWFHRAMSQTFIV